MSDQNKNNDQGVFSSLTSTVGTAGKNLGTTVGNTISSVGQGAGNAISDLSSGLGKTVSDASSGVQNTANATGKTYGDNAPEVLGGNSNKGNNQSSQ